MRHGTSEREGCEWNEEDVSGARKDGAIDTVVETVVALNADEIKTCRVRALCAADEVFLKL
jgi:hypothetical protein